MRWNTNPDDKAPQTFERDEADAAATALMMGGERIGWEPGDGTHYEFEILNDMPKIVGARRIFLRFCGRHWGNFVLPLTEEMPSGGYTARDYVLAHGPAGTYAGVRPLLAALGKAPGEWRLVPSDNHLEAVERERFQDHPPLNYKDARLGRAVRTLVEKQGDGTPTPEEARV